jgi:geranylgeranyl pyrophosphate synthase
VKTSGSLHIMNEIECRLHQLAPESDEPLRQAIRYALVGGGKRLRPLLVITAAEALGASTPPVDVACAVEMVHAYSLIHDDLPCMDDDDMRRGRPSLHRAFPEAIALLAGDTLLTDAFALLARAPHSDRQIMKMIQILSQRIGKDGMAGGQALDVLSSHVSSTKDSLIEMNQKKTGALFGCSLELGAVAANASSAQIDSLYQAGLYFGLAYQIQDDMQDKSREEKPTLLSLKGLAECQTMLTHCLDQMNYHLASLQKAAFPIQELLSSG